MTSFDLSHLFKDLISKCSHILKSWGLGFQRVPQPGTACWFRTGCGTSPITSPGGHIAASQEKGAPAPKPQPQGALSLAGFPEEQKLRCTRRHLWGRKFWALPVQSINLISTSRDHSDSLPGKARFQTQSVC